MKKPSKHGIDKNNCKLSGHRLFIAFRDLKKDVKAQAEHHLKHCKNNDTDEKVMNKCNCGDI